MGKEDEEPRKSEECDKLDDADARELCEHLARDLEIATNAEHTSNAGSEDDDGDGKVSTSSTGPKDEA